MSNIIYRQITNEELDKWVESSIKQHKKAMEAKEEKENNPPECPSTCELKEQFLDISKEEELEVDKKEVELLLQDIKKVKFRINYLKDFSLKEQLKIEEKYKKEVNKEEERLEWGYNRLKILGYNGSKEE